MSEADRLAEAAKKFFDIWNEFGDMGASTLFECLRDYFPALEAALAAYDTTKAVREAEQAFLDIAVAAWLQHEEHVEDGKWLEWINMRDGLRGLYKLKMNELLAARQAVKEVKP